MAGARRRKKAPAYRIKDGMRQPPTLNATTEGEAGPDSTRGEAKVTGQRRDTPERRRRRAARLIRAALRMPRKSRGPSPDASLAARQVGWNLRLHRVGIHRPGCGI